MLCESQVVRKGPRQKRKERRRLGPLAGLLTNPRTRARYDRALAALFAWMRASSEPWPETGEEADVLLSRYLCELWESGDSRHWGSDALSALQLYIPV